MKESLFPFYERELQVIRQLTEEFQRRHRPVADRLYLEESRSADSHVERLFQSFAFIMSGVQRRLSDDYPEITDAILQVLYPHFLAPIPSLAMMEFQLDPQLADSPRGFFIPRNSYLRTSTPNGVPCRYRTCSPVRLWPFRIQSVNFLPPPFPFPQDMVPEGAVSALRLQMQYLGQEKLSNVPFEPNDSLRLYLNGPMDVVHRLYEFLFLHAINVVFRGQETNVRPWIASPEQALEPVGFDRDDDLFPYPESAIGGYRNLTEFFCYPQKFHFIDLKGWARLKPFNFQKTVEIVVFFRATQKALEQKVDTSLFRVGCVPVVNLFDQRIEGIRLRPMRHQYKLVPDPANTSGYEVFSVDQVSSHDPATNITTVYPSYFSMHHTQTDKRQTVYWRTERMPSIVEGDLGTEVTLHFQDLSQRDALPDVGAVQVQTSCTNRDLPTQLDASATFTLEMSAPLRTIQCLGKPKPSLRPTFPKGGYWKILSHLNLNHLSLVDSKEGLQAWREILSIYHFTDAEGNAARNELRADQVAEGITGISHQRVVGRLQEAFGTRFARGVEIAMEFDTEKLGSSVFIVASLLERFLGLYVSENSFTQFVARLAGRKDPIKRWPARKGRQPLV